MQARGIKVIFRKPVWVEEEDKTKKEKDPFVYPADKSEGCGRNLVRKRKVELFR